MSQNDQRQPNAESEKNRESHLDAWRGVVGERGNKADIVVQTILDPDHFWGGTGVFMARDAQGDRWWVKPPNQLQGGRVLVTEHIVGRIGKLLGAPVPQVAIAEIPKDLGGSPLLHGATLLEAGLGHASQSVGDVDEEHCLIDRDRDDNARRHAGIFALYDLCWGGDRQWLYEQTKDRRTFSHDHGWYLPEEGADWNEESLLAHVDDPHPLQESSSELDSKEIERLAQRLEQLDRDELVPILRGVPSDWPVTDSDLEALGYFLERRAPAAAARLRALPL